MIRTVPHSEHINSVVFVFDVRDGIEYQFEEAQSYLGQHKKPRVKTCPGLAQLSLVYTLLLSLPPYSDSSVFASGSFCALESDCS